MGTVSAECFGCAVNAGVVKPAGGTIYEDDCWIADHGIDRLVCGYVVLKTKRHVHELADLTSEEAATLGGAAKRLLAAMRAALGTERIYICSFAETVHYLHFHLLPRYPEMPGLSDRMVPDLFAGKWSCSAAEAENASTAIRAALASN
jgi:diadenosine tetraphosphate (Ap4A) HIT family hydrolase